MSQGRVMETQEPLTVELFAYAPVAFFHCQHCELVWQHAGLSRGCRREQLASSLPDDLQEEYRQISDWVREMMAAYGDRITFRVIDAASIEGWFKSVRYGIHKFPAVVVDHKEKIAGLDFERAAATIRQRMARRSAT